MVIKIVFHGWVNQSGWIRMYCSSKQAQHLHDLHCSFYSPRWNISNLCPQTCTLGFKLIKQHHSAQYRFPWWRGRWELKCLALILKYFSTYHFCSIFIGQKWPNLATGGPKKWNHVMCLEDEEPEIIGDQQ